MPRVRPKELQTLETLERNWPACPIGTTVSSARHRFNNFLISPLFSFYSFFSTPDGQKPINATGFFNVFYCGTSISSPAFLLSSFLSIISLLYFVWFDCAVMQSPWRLIQLRPGTLLRYVGFLSPNMLFSLSLSRFRRYSTCSCFSFRPYIVPCCLPCRFWCNGARIDFDTDRYFQPTRLLLYASSIRHASYVFEYIAYLSSPRRPIINNKLLRTKLSFVTRPIFD